MNAWENIFARIIALVDRHFEQLDRIEKNQEKIMLDLTALTAEVTANTNATNAAKALLTALTAEIATISAGSTDPATQTALNALVSTLQANDQGLAAAVVANTPAAPPA